MCLLYVWNLDVKYILNLCNYHDIILHNTMWFLSIRHEYSHMSLKNNVSCVWTFMMLNMYKYHSY
jgi:hypothetical protein